jgi:hypothetical protein
MEEPIKTWIDDLPEHIATEADLADLFARVEALRAKREASKRASSNGPTKISAINPANVLRVLPVRPRQLELFP